MKVQLSQKEKEAEKARKNLQFLQNGIRSGFQFREIHTWYSVYKMLGHPEEKCRIIQPQGPLTLIDLNNFFTQQKQELEEKLNEHKERDKKEEKRVEVARQTNTTTQTAPSPLQAVATVESQKVVELKTELSAVSLSAENNYGWVNPPGITAFLYWFQKKAASEAVDKIVNKKYPGILLIAPTGTGKTFITGAIEAKLKALNFHEGRTFSPITSVYFGKKTIMEQSNRVFKNFFGLVPNGDIECLNIESVRSKRGEYWIKTKVQIIDGEEEESYEFKRHIQPSVIYVDESQGTKNKKAKQTQCISAYNDIPAESRCLVSISATPFMRVSDARVFAVSTNRSLEHLGFPKGTRLTNENWGIYAKIICGPNSDPADYNKAAVDRLVSDLDDYIVRVRGVRPQFEADNRVEVVHFLSKETEKFYFDAQERAQRDADKIKASAEAGASISMCLLAVLIRFAVAAEFCHAEVFAKDMYEAWQKGKAPVCAVKFKGTLIEIVRLLIEKHGIKRDNISLIWGGGQTKLTKKQEAKAKVKEAMEKLKQTGMSEEDILSCLGLSDEEVDTRVVKTYPKEWRLGAQDIEERQDEIDKFQSGRSQFCIYTLKAGGVGLSLHHTDELTKFKCRRKDSGYTVEEDIPKVPVRPRETFVCVTYNAVELVQGIGRVPRLTSLSKTIQHIRCYFGTVEMHMAEVYSKKLTCLSAVVKQREDWQQVILGNNRTAALQEILDKTKDRSEERRVGKEC